MQREDRVIGKRAWLLLAGVLMFAAIAAMHFSSIAIGVGSAVMPSVVRQGAVAGSRKCSA